MPHESRSHLIAFHVRVAIRHSGGSMRAFAIDVVEHYHRTVPLHLRDVQFHVSDDVHADARANAQLLQRMLDTGPVRLPVSLEDSVVLCLPQPYRAEALSDLCGRWGLLAAPLPGSDGARDAVTLGELLRETGELMTTVAPVLADGRIDARDAPHARRVLKEITDVESRLVSLRQCLLTAMAEATPTTATNVAAINRKAG